MEAELNPNVGDADVEIHTGILQGLLLDLR